MACPFPAATLSVRAEVSANSGIGRQLRIENANNQEFFCYFFTLPPGRPYSRPRVERAVGEGRQDAKASRRMLAIALVLDGWSREAAAEACAMDHQTLRGLRSPVQCVRAGWPA